MEKLKVELTKDQWQVVIDCLEASAAPHINVKQSISALLQELQPQLKKEPEAVEAEEV